PAALGPAARPPPAGSARPGGRTAARPHAAGWRMRVPAALPVCDRSLRRGTAAAGTVGRGRPSGRVPARRGNRPHAGVCCMNPSPLLEVKGLRIHFPVTEGLVRRRVVGEVKAVDGIDFTVGRGETMGLVGESGCGKTTTGRCILRLEKPTGGQVIYDGADMSKVEGQALRNLRKRVQVVFQDPYSS